MFHAWCVSLIDKGDNGLLRVSLEQIIHSVLGVRVRMAEPASQQAMQGFPRVGPSCTPLTLRTREWCDP